MRISKAQKFSKNFNWQQFLSGKTFDFIDRINLEVEQLRINRIKGFDVCLQVLYALN